MFDWRQWRREGNWRGVERDWRGPQARRRPRALLGALLCLALLALPLAAEEMAKAEPDVGLKARGQAFWEARIKEDYAAQYGLLEPKVRRQLSLTDYIKAQGPLQYLEARIEGVTDRRGESCPHGAHPDSDQIPASRPTEARDSRPGRVGETTGRVVPRASPKLATWSAHGDASWRVMRCTPPQSG